MKLTEFDPDHLLEIEMMNTPDGVPDIKRIDLLSKGKSCRGINAFTAIDNGKIIGCGGVKMLWQGVGEAWFIPSVHVLNAKRDVVLLCKEGLRMILKNNPEMVRIHAVVKEGFDAGDRLARYLGFECEGLMRKYGKDGSNYKLFALVR